MAFDDLAAFIDPGFDLKLRGKTYRVPAPDARTGVYLQSVIDAGESLLVTRAITAANRVVLSDDEERTVYQMALGRVYDEMLDDGVPWPALKHAGMTALLYWTRSAELAEAFWAGGGAGKAETGTASPPAGSPEDRSIPQPA